jgi:hypothetical protein
MPTTGEVKIGHERVFVVLSDVHDGSSTRSSRGELRSMHVHVELPYLRADAQVWRSDSAIETPLAPFFDELGAQWKGWEGVKEWRNYDGNFALSCTNDGLGHVTVTVELQVPSLRPLRSAVRLRAVLREGSERVPAPDGLPPLNRTRVARRRRDRAVGHRTRQ